MVTLWKRKGPSGQCPTLAALGLQGGPKGRWYWAAEGHMDQETSTAMLVDTDCKERLQGRFSDRLLRGATMPSHAEGHPTPQVKADGEVRSF